MKTHRRSPWRALAGAPVGALLLLAGSAVGQVWDVDDRGSYSPHISNTPYQVIRSAAPDAPGGELLIKDGSYRESGIYDTPAVLTANTGGVVTIGKDIDAGDSTTLTLAALNTHMAGDTVFPSWRDNERNQQIAEICQQQQWDFVGFSEIWDEDFFCDDCCDNCGPDSSTSYTLLEHSGYLNGRMGDDHDCTVVPPVCDTYHSGLAIMSKQVIQDFAQYSFTDCAGLDCYANKGFLFAKIQKDGFNIRIVNTHLQAGNDGSSLFAREDQMVAIAAVLLQDMVQHPGDVYFIMGDLNVPGEAYEYNNFMRSAFADHFNDGAPNAPGFIAEDQATNSPDNELSLCFDCDTTSNRLDYILYTPTSLDQTVRVVPRSTGVYPFLGNPLMDDCGDCPDGSLTTNELSDHWAVTGEYEIFRP